MTKEQGNLPPKGASVINIFMYECHVHDIFIYFIHV